MTVYLGGLYDDRMPRTARASVGGLWYHVLNRGNRREAVFHKPGDYDSFVEAIIDARARLPLDILGYCLMPNHFHLVIRPHADGDLGRWVQWLLMAHARRYHRHYRTSGHVWQGRFKAFPTMLKRAPNGGSNKRGWAHAVDNSDLLPSDFHALHQRSNDIATLLPTGSA